MIGRTAVAVVVVGVAAVAGMARADVFSMPAGQKSLELVTVGDPGNAADTRYVSTGVGGVGYTYQLGKYDVTAGQYCQFLNAVAATGDPYQLYNSNMADDAGPPSGKRGCGITRSYSASRYTYSATGCENVPVNYVSWGDAVRFANWLSSGQPTGAEGPGTTETGAYTLNGATSNAALMGIVRNPGATYVIPTEDEWYKAAYYKGESTDAGYWLYPTRNDTPPSGGWSPSGTNNANYESELLQVVGYFAGSPSPYGTFDQGGNVSQWNEAILYDAYLGWCRGGRGGASRAPSRRCGLTLKAASFPRKSIMRWGLGLPWFRSRFR